MTCTYNAPRHKIKTTVFPYFSNSINSFFNTALGDALVNDEKKRVYNPAINAKDLDDSYVLEIAIPGFTKDDITIKTEKESLTIEGVINSDDQKKAYRLREFTSTNFEKSFVLPDNIEPNKIEANFVAGVLKIVLPKKRVSNHVRSRKINID